MTPGRLHHPEDGREIYNRIPAFFLDLNPGETKTYYLKIYSTNEVVNFNYFIQEYATYTESVQVDYLIIGLYFGALVLIIIINIFYFVSLKNRLFLVYCAYVLATLLVTLTAHGFAWLLIPDLDTSYHIAYFTFRLWPDIFLFFTMMLVSLKQYYPRYTKACYGFIIYHSIGMPILEFIDLFHMRTQLMAQWETTNWIIGLGFILTTVALSYKYNKYLLKYYLIAYGVLLVSMLYFCFYILAESNWLVVEHVLKIGTLTEIITFSFAVSRNFKITERSLKAKKEEEQKLHEKVKQLEMDVRKAQMNPHFMFNALTSIDYFILKNDVTQARHYLSKFSKLMRLTLDNSKNNFVPLHDELNALTFYIELEFLRLKSSWHTFEIRTNEKIDLDQIFVPPLILQPFVENAIWHGLQKKENSGKLIVDIDFNEGELTCTIEDDGVGIQKELVASVNPHKASGITITKERLTLIHNILKTTNKLSITDRSIDNIHATGTKVKFNMPYMLEYA
jgi:sensor histidine kinase YesM